MTKISITDRRSLRRRLDAHDVPWRNWGHGLSRGLSKLYSLIKTGECNLWRDTDGRLIIEVKTVAVDIFHIETEHILEWLCEREYHLKKGGVRRRPYGSTFGANIRPHETPVHAARRGLVTELGFRCHMRLAFVAEAYMPIERSLSFPGMFVSRHKFNYAGVICDRIYNQDGYTRRKRSKNSPAKKIVYGWLKQDMRRAPYAFRRFIET